MSMTILHKFHRWLVHASNYEAKWRSNNETNFDYYDGDQWSEFEKEALEARGQQATVLNMIRPTIDMVLALEAERRVNIQVTEREEDDNLMATLLTKLLAQVFEQNDKDYYASQSFREGLIGGRGWMMVRPYKDRKKQVQVSVDWVPWEECFIDPHHRKPDGSDARYVFRKVWMDRDQVKKKWPGKSDEIDSAFNEDYEGIENEAQGEGSRFEYYDKNSERICIVHCWYTDAEENVRYVIFSDEVFLRGSEKGENKDIIDIGMYPLIPFTAFRTRKGYPRGLVDLIKDPQDQINKLNSKYLWNVSSNRLIIEEGATDDVDDAHEEFNHPNGLVVLNNGGLNKMHLDNNLNENSYLAQHLQFMLAMMQRTSGINDAQLGYGGVNERSATQQRQRISQGNSVQTQLMESFHFTSKRVAEVALRTIGKYFDDRRIIRIAQPNGETEHYAVNDPVGQDESGSLVLANEIDDLLNYDVILKSVSAYSSTKEIEMQYLTEMAKSGALPQQLAGKMFLEASDMPNKENYIFQLEELHKQMAAQPQPSQ